MYKRGFLEHNMDFKIGLEQFFWEVVPLSILKTFFEKIAQK